MQMWQMLDYLGPSGTGDPRFAMVASALGDSVIRVGGITADWVRYQVPAGDSGPASPPNESKASQPDVCSVCSILARVCRLSACSLSISLLVRAVLITAAL